MDLVRAVRQAVESRMSISDFDAVLDMIAGGGAPSYSGKLVSPKNALGVSAVWKCVNVLSDDYASLDLPVFRWIAPGINREQARDHYLWPLLNEEANPRMSAYRFRKVMEAWRNLWGNAYAEIEINGRGQVTALWPWRPDRVKVYAVDPNDPRTEIRYAYIPLERSQNPIILPSDRMLHVRGLSLDGIVGLTPVEVHRQQLGLMLAMQEQAAKLYSNGMTLKSVIRHPTHLSVKAEASLKERLEAYRGSSNAHKSLILEEAMEYQDLGMKLADAQFIESMGYNDTDVAGIYKVPPHKIGILDKATFSNITQQEQGYINSTLDPIARNWNGEFHCSLLSGRERDSIFIDPDYTRLLVGDWEGLSKLLTAESNLGSLSPDEAREMFKRNPLPGGIGKYPRVPLNTAPLGSPEATNPDLTGKPAQRLNGLDHERSIN